MQPYGNIKKYDVPFLISTKTVGKTAVEKGQDCIRNHLRDANANWAASHHYIID